MSRKKEDYIVDGVDLSTWWLLKPRDVFRAEAKNHNPEIQLAIAWMYEGNFGSKALAALERKFKWRYFNADKRMAEIMKESNRLYVKWLEKAAAQNYAEAQLLANDFFMRAIEHGDEDAMKKMVDRYWNGEGIKQDRDAAQKLIDRLVATERYECTFYDYGPHLSEISMLENIRRINVNLYHLMFAVYGRVRTAKQEIDKLISDDKSDGSYNFLRGYKLVGKIKYDFDESEPLAASYKYAECEWNVSAADGKPLARKIDALHMMRTYPEGELDEFTLDYICYATHCFVSSKKANVPGEVAYCFPPKEFRQMKREKFYGEVTLDVAATDAREREMLRALCEELGLRIAE